MAEDTSVTWWDVARSLGSLAAGLGTLALLSGIAWWLVTSAGALHISLESVLWACVLVPIAMGLGIVGALFVVAVGFWMFAQAMDRLP